MSATSQSHDPVQAVIDLLSNTAEADWPSGVKPNPIEPEWLTGPQQKANEDGPAAYVQSPDRGQREALSADWDVADQRETVEVEVWSRSNVPGYGQDHGASYGTATDHAATIASDVLAVLEDYVNDKQANTRWDRIRPVQDPVDDQRLEASALRASQKVVSVRVELRREDSIGT